MHSLVQCEYVKMDDVPKRISRSGPRHPNAETHSLRQELLMSLRRKMPHDVADDLIPVIMQTENDIQARILSTLDLLIKQIQTRAIEAIQLASDLMEEDVEPKSILTIVSKVLKYDRSDIFSFKSLCFEFRDTFLELQDDTHVDEWVKKLCNGGG